MTKHFCRYNDYYQHLSDSDNKNLFLVGGRDDCTELSSAERYNPATNTWSPIVAMMSRRSGVSRNIL